MPLDIKEALGYEGETVVVTGAASGMGAETARLLAELGAEVYGLDIREVTIANVKYIPVNLRNKESIDDAISKLPDKIHKVFAVAGVAGIKYRDQTFDPVDVVMINFVGHRYLVDNIIPRIPSGNAIAMVASVAGLGWWKNRENVFTLVNISDFEQARKWLESQRNNPKVLMGYEYAFSKECIIAYAKVKAFQLAPKRIRVNVVNPGSTETPMLPDFMTSPLAKLVIETQGAIPGRYAKPIEIAWVLIFLNSKMASYVSGVDINVDYGYTAGMLTGQAPVTFVPIPGVD